MKECMYACMHACMHAFFFLVAGLAPWPLPRRCASVLPSQKKSTLRGSSSARDSSSPCSWALAVLIVVSGSRRAFFWPLSCSTVCWLGFMANAVAAGVASEFRLSSAVEKCNLRGVGPQFGPWVGEAWIASSRRGAVLGCW